MLMMTNKKTGILIGGMIYVYAEYFWRKFI